MSRRRGRGARVVSTGSAREAEIAPGPSERIAVFRAHDDLAGLLAAVPALHAIREAFPRAAVALVGVAGAEWFAKRFRRYVDECLVLPGFPGIGDVRACISAIPGFFARAQERRFTLALQMHGAGTYSNPATLLLGAERTAGLYLPGEFIPHGGLFAPYPEDEPEYRRCLRAAALVDADAADTELRFPLSPGERRRGRALAASRGVAPGTYACLNPGGGARESRWPARCWAAVADALARHGLPVVLVGERRDGTATRAVAALMDAPAVDLTGCAGTATLAAVVEKSRLVVSGDPGVALLAAALAVPGVLVATAADPLRWAAPDPRRNRTVGAPAALSTPPWTKDFGRCTRETPPHVPEPGEVLAHADELLAMGPAGKG